MSISTSIAIKCVLQSRVNKNSKSHKKQIGQKDRKTQTQKAITNRRQKDRKTQTQKAIANNRHKD
jgi:hypothetical protein